MSTRRFFINTKRYADNLWEAIGLYRGADVCDTVERAAAAFATQVAAQLGGLGFGRLADPENPVLVFPESEFDEGWYDGDQWIEDIRIHVGLPVVCPIAMDYQMPERHTVCLQIRDYSDEQAAPAITPPRQSGMRQTLCDLLYPGLDGPLSARILEAVRDADERVPR